MRRQSPPRRPTGFAAQRSPDEHNNVSLRQSGGASRRQRPNATSMLKQDSIAEETVESGSPSPSPGVAAPNTVATNFSFQCRHSSAGSQLSEMSPRLERSRAASRLATRSPTHERKGSLSPNAAPLFNSSASARRRGFQRAPSAAQSDVTDAQTRPAAIVEPTLQGCLSCENTASSRIRFDICSSGGSSLRNSNSSSLYRGGGGVTTTNTLPVPGPLVAGLGAASLKANGFVPKADGRDPSRWHFCITKQRSQSESAFNTNARGLLLPSGGGGGVSPTSSTGFPSISYHHDEAGILTAVRMGGGGGSASLSGCPAHRRCSMTILNPHKEQAILRRILGPNALDWLKNRDQLSKKSLSLVLSEDLEAQRPNNDDPKTPLMKEKDKGGGRLIQRQHLFHARRSTSDYALFFAIFGIILMVVENELSASGIYPKGTAVSFALKGLILGSTMILLTLVAKFHVHEVQLFMNANSAEDWRIALTWKRCIQITTELMACGVCPVPINIDFFWTTVHADGVNVTTTLVPLDVVLSIPMFFRLYWICRVMLLHSRLFTDASSRSIAGLNRVNFNARFILKTLMTLCPGTMLLVFTASLWVIAGWILRLCEHHHVGEPKELYTMALKHQNYLNSLWMIAITFLGVGYGDIVPNTFCGRSMAVITGVLGTCTSSMVVAVIARKLELTRAEKHVHNFMMDSQLSKKLKHSAANVLRETWLIYKYRRLVDKIDPAKIRHHQRKFLVAIYALRKVKRDQRKLAENSVSLGDVAKTTSNTYELIHDIHSTQEGLALRMTAVEHQLSDIQREIGTIADLLRGSHYRSSFSNGPEPADHSPAESIRRRKHQPLVDMG